MPVPPTCHGVDHAAQVLVLDGGHQFSGEVILDAYKVEFFRGTQDARNLARRTGAGKVCA
jgi:hypothetical protein